MIRLENISKVYRTDRIETLALEAINLSIVDPPSCAGAVSRSAHDRAPMVAGGSG